MQFDGIPGHTKVKENLRHLADTDTIPHAILLSGPSGIGKMNVARTFVQYAHCKNRRGGEPCGECSSCRQHQHFNHPDLHFIFPIVKNKAQKIETSADRIELWRQMLQQCPGMIPEYWMSLIEAGNSQPRIYVEDADYIVRADSYSSFSSKYKFFLIWLPEKMNPETANKLLKVIEEPTEGTVFLLVSNNDSELLPTIFSRTQRFNMRPVEEGEMMSYLTNRYHMDSATAGHIARLSHGSIAKADEFAGHTGERLEFQELFIDIMRNAYGKNPGRLREIGDKASGLGREKLRRFLEYMASMVRENFIYNLRLKSLTSMTPEEERFSERFSPYIHYANVEEMDAAIMAASRDIERNGNGKLILFSLFLQIIPLLHRKAG